MGMLVLTQTDDAAPAPLFETGLRIRWSDLDADGRVNNVLLLRLAEEARMQWAAELRLHHLAPDCMPVVASTAAVFHAAVRYPGEVSVTIGCSRLGRSSLHLQFDLRDADDASRLYAQALAVWVWVDKTTERAVPMPLRLRQACESGHQLDWRHFS